MTLTKGIDCGFVRSAPQETPTAGFSLNMDKLTQAFMVVAPAGTTKITEIGWWCSTVSEESNFEVGIYTHDVANSRPGNLSGSSTINAKGTTIGWKRATVNIPITPKEVYWIAIQTDDTITATLGIVDIDLSGKKDYKTNQTTLTDPWGASTSTGAYLPAFYAVCDEPAEVSGLQTNIIINGERITDVKTCKITNSLGNEQSNSDVEFTLNNPYGVAGSKYSAGQTADVYIEDASYKLMPENLKSGLIGYWRLEDKNDWVAFGGAIIGGSLSPVRDSIGNYRDGSNNSAIRNASAFINAGLNFKEDYGAMVTLLVDTADTKQNPSNWTVSFWDYYIDKAISGTGPIIVALKGNGTTSMQFFKTFNWDTTADHSKMHLYINAADDFAGSGVLSAANTWHHILGTYHAGSELTKLFIDGTLMGSLYGTAWEGQIGSLYFGATPFYVGFTGSIYSLDEIGIWDRPLSDSEIGSVYNMGLGVSYGNKIFSGRVEDVMHHGEENTETIELGGRDWGGVILDKTVQPEVYTNLPAGSIVRDVMNKYANEINIIEVGSGGTVIDKIAFNQVPVFDAVKQLADYGDQIFYVDETKKLRFRDKNSIRSQRTYDTSDSTNNILRSDFRERRDTMYNQVWVYGDRYLDGFKESFTQTAGLGSVFTLTHNPHNTEVLVNGSIWQPGGVYEMTTYAISGIMYLVDYDSKNIIFSSGTNTGDYIPKNGSVIVVNYKRSLPVCKVGDNEASKVKYGVRSKVIQDKSIKDPLTAQMIMLKELDNYSDPLKEGTIYIKGIDDIKVGETALLNIPHQGINETRYEANEIQYTLDDETMNSEHIMRIKFNKHLPDITDQLRKMMMDMRRMQSQDMTASDLITRYQYNTGSIGLRQDYVRVMPHSGATWEDAWVDHNHHYEDYLTGSEWVT